MTFNRILRLSERGRTPLTSNAHFTTAALPWAGFDMEVAVTDPGTVRNFTIEKPAVFVCTAGEGDNEWLHDGVVERRHITPGTVCLSSPHYKIQQSIISDEWEYCGVQFDAGLFQHTAPEQSEAIQNMDLNQRYNNDYNLATIILQMRNEARSGCRSGRLYAESLSLALLSYICAAYVRQVSKPGRVCLRPNQARLIKDFIEEHLDAHISLHSMARLVGLSASHFSRAFRASFGVSPYRYVLDTRLRRAKEVLSLTDTPIASIAIDLGFYSHSHFSERFRAQTGQTPAEFRRLRQTRGSLVPALVQEIIK
ncbi:helix-turn-helix transcriptional regulator [Chenggangzhangella methanolivorans]|uniref:AraC family transcriptional regulator n=1 Tax=Chenggangzhangella methanolivorans TaxID=1437009 RepID=A0A9E6UQ09_9HYPH|nr:AraC family transcriptional regulator [Chenggangzhangella methanolivorans]QZO02044.1 AraC family transcriptional regulator [Chenggangzhangella methanolivorans]